MTALARGLAFALLLPCAGDAVAAPRLQSAEGGAVHALVVGIDDYASVRPKLQGSVGDAEDIAANLRADGVADVHLLLDSQATRAAFVAQMTRLVDVSKPGDLAVVTYSGHGGTVPEYPQYKGLEPSGRTEEFIMADYATSGPATGEVITNKEMKAWLSRLDRKGVDVLFVADSCFGGGMVRGIPDPRAGAPLLRVARQIAPLGASAFQPIPMTPAELRTDVATLHRVTVLSGSDRFTPVPEVFIPAPPTRRGALSFAVARALEGEAATTAPVETTTRRQLFSYVRQEVQHYSDDQRIDNSPRASSANSASLDRPVFRMLAATPTPVAIPPVGAAAPCPTVHVALLHDDPGVRSSLAHLAVPVALADAPSRADLVWDVRAGQVIQPPGDVIASGIDASRIGGVIQRTAAVQCIKALSTVRPQLVSLRDGVRRYTPGDAPVLEAQDVAGRWLVVFDIASDGRLQVVWPEETRGLPMPRDTWSGRPDVIPPFGADYVVAVTSSSEPRDFLDWLNTNDNRLPSVAAQLPAWLRRIQARDATSRIGAVALYTAAR